MRPPSSLQPLLNHPILSPEVERELLVRVVDGDQRARDELVLHNARFVASEAGKWLGYGVDFEDLWQEGMIGLLDTLDRWEIDRPIRFSTYAWWWVRNRIQRYAQSHCSDIRWPARSQRLKRKIAKGEDVTDGQRATIAQAASVSVSLDQPATADGRMTVGEVTPADGDHDRVDAALDVERLLAEDCLDDRDRHVLLERARDRTLHEIGRELGLTRERVRQIEEDALRRVRDRVEAIRDGRPTRPKSRAVGLPGEQLCLPLFAEVAA